MFISGNLAFRCSEPGAAKQETAPSPAKASAGEEGGQASAKSRAGVREDSSPTGRGSTGSSDRALLTQQGTRTGACKGVRTPRVGAEQPLQATARVSGLCDLFL